MLVDAEAERLVVVDCDVLSNLLFRCDEGVSKPLSYIRQCQGSDMVTVGDFNILRDSD